MRRIKLFNLPNDWTDIEGYVDSWLIGVAQAEGFAIRRLTYSFMSDSEMLNENRRLLDHDYYTDIITYGEVIRGRIEGDVIISSERIIDNAKELKKNELDERDRVLVHGLLHLCGYDDTSEEEKLKMRQLEDKYLLLRP